MARNVEIVIKATDKASKTFKEVGKSAKGMDIDFKKLAIGAGVAVGALGAVAVAGKAAFEFGKQGAAITQTSESFDLLLEKVGATPGLLEDLRDASRGTISDFELMSSTATLLAGASGELGTELANATPRLMEIAKAANKLNPALGSTAFMYNSIATGVKRAQPLILDNLGLTIKVGTANEKMAKKLGKTVDQLTASEKSMAILNATLEAGDVMLNQVGGSTDSATDSFERLEVAWKNYADSKKEDVAEIIIGVVDMADAELLLRDAFEKGLYSADVFAQTLDDLITRKRTAADVTEEVDFKMQNWQDTIDGMAGPMSDYYFRMGDITEATELAIEPTTTLDGAVANLAGSYDAAKTQATLLNEAVKIASDGLVDAERKKLVLKIATENLSKAEMEQAITELETTKNLDTMNKLLDDGKMTWGEYVQTVADGVVTQDEMNKLLGVLPDAADPATDSMDSLYSSTSEAHEAMAIARRQGIFLQDVLSKFTDIEFTVTGNFVMSGFPGGGSGSFTPSGGVGGPPIYGGQFGGPGGQHGLSMTVPGGFPNDTYPIRASSGEHVEITPKGQGGGGMVVINNYNNSAAAAAMAYDEAINMAYAEQNEGMGV